MGLSHISSDRPLFSYAKVQRVVSAIKRNRPLFFSRKTHTADRLNIGCGLFPVEALVNLDRHWCPGVDVCWDLRRPLPFPAERFTGVFSEHCIDGMPPRYFRPCLQEMHRVLRPGGTLRLVFCDAERYVDAYVSNREHGTPMPYAEERGITHRMEALDHVFHHPTHRTLVDFDRLARELRACGFSEVVRVAFRQGRDPALLQDRAERRDESLYVEAVK